MVVCAWLALIFVSSQIAFPPPHPFHQVGWFDYVFDKNMHFLLYGILAVLVVWWLSECGWRRRVIYITALALALTYGVFDEWHQTFVPGRSASSWDVAFNVLGAWGGSMLWYIWVEWDTIPGLLARRVHARGTAGGAIE
jgi:VanZ family protein